MIEYCSSESLKDFKQKYCDKHMKKKNLCNNTISKIETLIEKIDIKSNLDYNKSVSMNKKNNDNNIISKTKLLEKCNELEIKNCNLKNKEEKQKIINYVDLFCGLGAFHKAFELNNS